MFPVLALYPVKGKQNILDILNLRLENSIHHIWIFSVIVDHQVEKTPSNKSNEPSGGVR